MDDLGMGYLYTTGSGDSHQLGFEADEAETPTLVESLENVRIRQVVCGSLQTFVLAENNKVFSFGNNEEGGLGRATPDFWEDEFTPAPVLLPDDCIQIAGGDSHCAALLRNGDVYAWGSFQLFNEMRHGVDFRTEEKLTQNPVVISTNLPKVVQIASGASHLVMLCEDGNVFTLGDGTLGQLGRKLPCRFRGDVIKHLLEPAKVYLIRSSRRHRAINVWTGENATFVQCENSFWVFGNNNMKQCGVSSRDEPLIVYPTSKNELASQKWKCIAGGEFHTVALNSEGAAYSFGRNVEGQCGIGRRKDGTVMECVQEPTIIPALSKQKIVKVAAGNRGSFAINGDGNLFVWGLREYIGLGDEADNQEVQEQPRLITQNNVEVRDVDGGAQHSAMVIHLHDSD